MKRTLLLKFIVCYIVTAISLFILLNTYGIARIQHSLLEEKKDILYQEANLISSEYMSNYFLDNLSLFSLKTQLKGIDTFLDTRIWFVKTDGSILLDTREDSAMDTCNLLDDAPAILKNSFNENVSITGKLPEPMLTASIPITTDYALKGYVVMLTSMSGIKENSIHYANIINYCFFFFLVILYFIFWYLYHLTVHPLHAISQAAMEYTRGNYDFPCVVRSHDEYRELCNSMNYIAGELGSLDDYQKKFIANISHDFRSPLTSIKGYAEAMLDGTIPYEMQGKYLDIILFETRRLTKLTSNLLELNSFKNRGADLDISAFDINQVIKQTARSFEGSLQKKNLQLNLTFSEKEIYVSADIGKIEQVLHNLIDNAIKFSSNDASIDISAETRTEKVFISVRDYGIGIARENINKVWDRFYKIDTSRGKDKKGTGLGLSITREIINAHGENINLISTEGVGSEFIFTLPMAKNRS